MTHKDKVCEITIFLKAIVFVPSVEVIFLTLILVIPGNWKPKSITDLQLGPTSRDAFLYIDFPMIYYPVNTKHLLSTC